MNKSNILKELISTAEKFGEITDVGFYETWLYVTATTDDGTKVRFDVNIAKEEENNVGNTD